MENKKIDDIDFEQIKKNFSDFKRIFENGDKEKACDMLKELLDSLEDGLTVRKAGKIQNDLSIVSGENNDVNGDENNDGKEATGNKEIYISLNHVMEYYIFQYYFKPEANICCSEIPFAHYYRTYGDFCMTIGKYHAANKAYKKAIEWNPVDLDAILGLAETYKYLEKMKKYLKLTKAAHRYCCTRATMARYYRNMGFYYVSSYKTELARACYIYSNIYYHTDNADNELKYLETALNDKTPNYDIRTMQAMFDKEGIEPGPESDTVGIIYQVGKIMLNDGEKQLAKDCLSIVYDITQEEEIEKILNSL